MLYIPILYLYDLKTRVLLVDLVVIYSNEKRLLFQIIAYETVKYNLYHRYLK